MIRMTVQEMVQATDARLLCGDASLAFEGVAIDTRVLPKGGLFVAFAGERVDANKFAPQAFDAGALAVVLTAEPDEQALEAAQKSGGVLLRAANDDGEQFMLALAKAWRNNNPQWIVVGVTGSVGKTTTKEMLAAGIGATKRVHATVGNFNNLLGVPLTLFAASPEDEVLVVEMGMNNAGEIARIADAAQPDVAVITNVGTSHVGNLGSREGIARAKAEVVGGMRGTQETPATLILSDGDDFADFIEQTYCKPAQIRCVRVGGSDGTITAPEVSLDENGLPTVKVCVAGRDALCGTLSLPGRAMVYDLLSSLGAIHVLGLPLEASFDAICKMQAAHMRLEVRQQNGTARVIDDSYNASPSSMAAALDVLCSMKCAGRRVAVLGEMGELGEQSARLHELVGAYAAAKPVDLLVLIGEGDALKTAEAARTMGFSEDHLETFSSVREAARVIVPLLKSDDLVLVKASRAAGLDRFAEEVLGA